MKTIRRLTIYGALLVVLLVPGLAFAQSTAELEDGPICDSLPPEPGCIQAHEELFDPSGATLSFGPIATLLGTCDDAKDCAKPIT